MAYKTSYELHHYFPRLAEESGFTFNTHRPRIHIDWNKIKLIDIDSLIREKKFSLIEQHINDVLDCVLESEFDVRILDEGVMKMFRLAQLALEYQQFCRHYLDQSVYVLKEEITSLAQALDASKKELREKDEELRRIRKRSKHIHKTPLPYGNENIAAMILKTLTHKTDLFQTTSNENLQYNKCKYCEKVFLNQLYLKSHISRRHTNNMEIPEKDIQVNDSNNENAKLSAEITELRNKLQEMELMISNTNNQPKQFKEIVSKELQNEVKINQLEVEEPKKQMKDTGVSTNNEDYLFNRIEELKKEEYENYNKVIIKLRTQMMETINTLMEKEYPKHVVSDINIIEQLHATIKEQGIEIATLKKELHNAKIQTDLDNIDKNKEVKTQIASWAKRAEDQSKQYEQLLQKLNDVAKDAKESRTLAETKTKRAALLQELLQQIFHTEIVIDNFNNTNETLTAKHKLSLSDVNKSVKKEQYINKKIDQDNHKRTLDLLQRKAQELLSIGSVSSTSSEISSEDKVKPLQMKKMEIKNRKEIAVDINENNDKNVSDTQKPSGLLSSTKRDPQKAIKKKVHKKDKFKSRNKTLKASLSNILPGSPAKVVRAKITEEVNNRLVSAGVDPLKSRLPQNVFHKKRTQIQQQQELKRKQNPNYDKVKHSILSFLDTNISNANKDATHEHEYISPSKVITKPFQNLSSMMSNVKSKALSLVKLNDINTKNKHKFQNTDVAKRALSLLKTPPGSTPTSPVTMKNSPRKATINLNHNNSISKTKSSYDTKNTSNNLKTNSTDSLTIKHDVVTDTDRESEGSEHKYYNSGYQSSKSIENLIKSPVRRPSSATTDYVHNVSKYVIRNDNLPRTQSSTNLTERSSVFNGVIKASMSQKNGNSSDDVASITENTNNKHFIVDNATNTIKQTKGVLKNASSISSLNKKKVLFDMDAIQMKSVSASPSQSITEKSNGNEKYELGLVNLDNEEWDISSIENELLKNDTKIQNVTRTSPKIAELREKIEYQLARRNDTATITLAGKVDVLTSAMGNASSIGGSNTSLGSSILDESENAPVVNRKAFVKSKKISVKDDSDIDISEFSIDGIAIKNESF